MSSHRHGPLTRTRSSQVERDSTCHEMQEVVRIGGLGDVEQCVHEIDAREAEQCNEEQHRAKEKVDALCECSGPRCCKPSDTEHDVDQVVKMIQSKNDELVVGAALGDSEAKKNPTTPTNR